MTAIQVDKPVIEERSSIQPFSQTLAQAITGAPCYASITTLDLRPVVTIAAADALLNGLPQLRDLCLVVCSDKHASRHPRQPQGAVNRKASVRLPDGEPLPLLQHRAPPFQVWRPSGPGVTKLRSLAISTTQDMAVDVSGLETSACLVSLRVKTGATISWSKLPLTQQKLELLLVSSQEHTPEPMPLDLAWLAELDQLMKELALLPTWLQRGPAILPEVT